MNPGKNLLISNKWIKNNSLYPSDRQETINHGTKYIYQEDQSRMLQEIMQKLLSCTSEHISYTLIFFYIFVDNNPNKK